ncbi:hypothetical protein [Nocardioides sp. LMS-CY]|nr:hypothetical protein [Nocardioides sp. LMS-CY]
MFLPAHPRALAGRAHRLPPYLEITYDLADLPSLKVKGPGEHTQV